MIHGHVLKIKDKYVKAGSYRSFSLVDHPFKATIYDREKDAHQRVEKCKEMLECGLKKHAGIKPKDIKVMTIEVIKYNEHCIS